MKSISKQINNVARQQTRGRSVILHKYGTITSSAGGVLSDVFETNDITNTDDYSGFTGHYDEYRVLGGILRVHSALGPGSTSACSIYVLAYDHDDNTALGNIANGIVYGTSKTFDVGRDPTITYHFTTPKSMLIWRDASAAASQTGGIKSYADGLANSTIYARYELELLVEFRGRR